MLSKKQVLILGAAAIAGTGIGLMMLGGGGDAGEGEKEAIEESKKEFLIQYSAPIHAPTDIYAPYEEQTITEIVHNVITYLNTPPVTPPPEPKPPDYYSAVGRSGGGYEGAPDVPGYVPMGIVGGEWKYTSKKDAIAEAVAAGLPQEVAERELSIYSNGGGGGRRTKSTPKKTSTSGMTSAREQMRERGLK